MFIKHHMKRQDEFDAVSFVANPKEKQFSIMKNFSIFAAKLGHF